MGQVLNKATALFSLFKVRRNSTRQISNHYGTAGIVFQESVQAAIAHVIAIIWYYNILCKESNTSYMLLCVCSRNSGKGQVQWQSNENIQSVFYWPIL
jgi:hypothetical protein